MDRRRQNPRRDPVPAGPRQAATLRIGTFDPLTVRPPAPDDSAIAYLGGSTRPAGQIQEQSVMNSSRRSRRFVGTSAIALALMASTPASVRAATQDTRFFIPVPNAGSLQQIEQLLAGRDAADALLIGRMITTPQAVWFTNGTPQSVNQNVTKVVREAALQRAVPVLVAYNIPFRDCSQYSAGGAPTNADYLAWIDGFASGIGNAKAIVILEPDGLGIIPFNTDINGNLEWCQPSGADPTTAADERFQTMGAAVDRLMQQPNVSVYLDSTQSAWLGVGDAAKRLVRAGVQRASGFFINVSNFQADDRLQKYGTWVSKCIWFGSNPGSWGNGHYDWCASQYYPATESDFSTWGLTDQWYVNNVESQTWVPYPGDAGLTRFVVDTSRNGQGAWIPPAHPAGDPQDWCNPPDRGLGQRPTSNTGVTLIDAYLWIKIPGESDGQCSRWTPGPLDPVRGMADPAPGTWFPEMALELVHNANPALISR
jgi:endoglucanase